MFYQQVAGLTLPQSPAIVLTMAEEGGIRQHKPALEYDCVTEHLAQEKFENKDEGRKSVVRAVL